MTSTQDWEVVTIRKRTQPTTKKNTLVSAIREGKPVDLTVKHDSGKNKQTSHTTPSNIARKLDEEEIPKLPQVSTQLRSNIQSARQAKNMTQKELAQRINEKPSLISQYESGHAVPSNAIIDKLERALGVRLRAPKNGK